MSEIVLISPMEVSLHSNEIALENIIRTDKENIKRNPVNSIYITQSRENLGIGALASYLREKGISVKIINSSMENLRVDQVVEQIITQSPKVVGINLLYDLHAYNACRIIIEARKNGYSGHITLGGPFISFAYEYFLLGIPGIDSVIKEEAEFVLNELVSAFIERREWKNIPGLVWLNEKKHIVVNPPYRSIKDFSILPFPARDTLLLMKKEGLPVRVASIYASRGCRNKCIYYMAPFITALSDGKKWRARPAKSVVDEIEYLTKDLGIEYLYFCDDNFSGYGRTGRQHLHEIANLLIDRNIKVLFHTEIRVDSGLDEESLVLLKKAGLHEILLGLESGAQSALNRWKKGSTVTQNLKMVKLVHK